MPQIRCMGTVDEATFVGLHSLERLQAVSRSQIFSINCSLDAAGRSGLLFAVGASIPPTTGFEASPLPPLSEADEYRIFCRFALIESCCLLAASYRLGLRAIVTGWPSRCSAFRPWSASLAAPTA
jgi:hypothetical protein